MSTTVLTQRFSTLPPVCERDVLRYAGCREADESTLALMRACEAELCDKLAGAVCYCELPLTVRDALCDMGAFSVHSEGLARYFEGCRRVVLFAATVGVATDRVIAKYSCTSPARALLFQALGAERIEALCDAFCEQLMQERRVKPSRFSPGYGDLPLAVQREIFRVLEPQRRIGLCLNDSLLMSPSKSVTAFVGIQE